MSSSGLAFARCGALAATYRLRANQESHQLELSRMAALIEFTAASP